MIIKDFTDNDLYKFKTSQFAYLKYPGRIAKFEFVNRSNYVFSREEFERIKSEINELEDLSLKNSEYNFLVNYLGFDKDYCDLLKAMSFFSDQEVNIEFNEGNLKIEAEGSWYRVTFYEIWILSIISEVIFTSKTDWNSLPYKNTILFEQKLNQLRESNIQYIDFGTRRRCSHSFQDYAINVLSEKGFPQFLGTSNVFFAMKNFVPCCGTNPHEYFQAFQAIEPNLRNFQKRALKEWAELYPNDLTLTDVINSDVFAWDFDKSLAEVYKGVRQDSGDPLVWFEKTRIMYERLGIDPKTKTFGFSDGLDFKKAQEIKDKIGEDYNLVFGIGTSVMNNTNHPAPSIVMKLVEFDGKPVAKISDDPAKSICRSDKFLNKLRKTFFLGKTEKINNIPFARMLKLAHKEGERAYSREEDFWKKENKRTEAINKFLFKFGYKINFNLIFSNWYNTERYAFIFDPKKKIKGTTFYRLGRAALKQGKLIDLNRLLNFIYDNYKKENEKLDLRKFNFDLL